MIMYSSHDRPKAAVSRLRTRSLLCTTTTCTTHGQVIFCLPRWARQERNAAETGTSQSGLAQLLLLERANPLSLMTHTDGLIGTSRPITYTTSASVTTTHIPPVTATLKCTRSLLACPLPSRNH